MSFALIQASLVLHVFILLLVDHSPFLVLVACPLAVAVDGGRCLTISPQLKPRNDIKSSRCLGNAEKC